MAVTSQVIWLCACARYWPVPWVGVRVSLAFTVVPKTSFGSSKRYYYNYDDDDDDDDDDYYYFSFVCPPFHSV